MAILDEIIKEDKNHFRDNALSHWYRYTILVEKHLLKIIMYYKESLSEETLVEIEEVLESLYLEDIKRLPNRIEYWNSSSKLKNIANNMSEFDRKIRG
ncbi:hypothetical protein KHA80_12525 [Anaerobacillus sp. HL2]|nr:hypothetical protein KHA80_12525 [Anaerobacillus sp. HL2]